MENQFDYIVIDRKYHKALPSYSEDKNKNIRKKLWISKNTCILINNEEYN